MWCETCPKWPSSMKGKGRKKLKQLKALSLKIQDASSKSVVITDKKGKQYVRQIIYPSTKVTPVIDFTYESVVENTFVCRWLQINDKNDK